MYIKKENWPLILAFAAPLIMILIVAGSVYLPTLSAKPKFDFIYSIGSYYNNYGVDIDGKIYKIAQNQTNSKLTAPVPPPGTAAQLYYYNVSTGKNTQLTVDQAQIYKLDPSQQSADGYTITNAGNGGGLFPLFIPPSNDYNAKYISGHGINKKINLPLTPNYYDNFFNLIGWVIK